MKAFVLESKASPMVLREIETPLLRHGMVEIEMKAAALNHRDLWITKGMYAGIQYPMVLGSDGAGIVRRVGRDASPDKIGMEVLVNPSFEWGEEEDFQGKEYKILGLPDFGTFSDTLVVPETAIHPMPAHLSFVQAAALPLAGLTAYRALVSRAKTGPGDKVLVTGAGGGVAQFAIQFALAIGCEVWVTSGSADKIKLAKAAGAKGGANYKDLDWASSLKAKSGAFSVIIDGAGGAGFGDLIDLAAPGGRIAIYGGTRGNLEAISPQKIFWKQLSILGTTMGSPTDFHNMLHMVNRYQLVPVIDEVFRFTEAASAFAKMEAGTQVGKLVLEH